MSSAQAVGKSDANLSPAQRWLILIVAFLGWLFAGVHMSITQMTGQVAALDLLERMDDVDAKRYVALNKLDQAKKNLLTADKSALDVWKPRVTRWFAWFQCAFLFGAATGGLVFGWLGDHIGRSKAMAASILTYAALAAAAAAAQTPWQFAVLWFLACTGVGGMWPNGVALVSEAWSGMSRPMVAGVIGVAANIGIFLFATLERQVQSSPENWRWALFVGAAPILLGLVAFVIVPESPRWLAARDVSVVRAASLHADANVPAGGPHHGTETSVFRPPLLWITVVAIVLATVPMIGGWGTANWMNPWAEEAGGAVLKATSLQTRSIAGIVGSLFGGWIASTFGRRRTYFFVSVASLGLAQYIFWQMLPTDWSFLIWVGVLGFVSGIYFGWLPLCLPELFPTRVRSTGAGVGFNFGRIVTAVTLFAGGALMGYFEGDYARLGRVTSLLFILGIVFIWFAPDTSAKELAD